jgi:hypothetical protein
MVGIDDPSWRIGVGIGGFCGSSGWETIVVARRAAWGFGALVGGLAGIASAVEVSA